MFTNKELLKVKICYKKLNIQPNFMTLKGFYLLFGEDIQHFNINKLHTLGQLYKTQKNFKKYIKRIQT